MAKLFKNGGALTKWGKKVAYALIYADAAGCNRSYTSWMRKLHGIEFRGRGRFVRLSTALHDDAMRLLDALGVAYELGNDAPRGGRVGTFIRFEEKAFCEALFSRLSLK